MTRGLLSYRDIAANLADQAEALCPELLPNGRREGAEWRVGSVQGEPGQSLGVRLTGPKAGVWCDFASAEGGDLLDLIAAVNDVDLKVAIGWAKRWLGLDRSGAEVVGVNHAKRKHWPASNKAAALTEDDRQRIDAARRFWASGRAVKDDDPAGRYLASRGLPGPWPGTLKFLPNARHPSGATLPALVTAACRWPDRAPAAVQFTALTLDGHKAPVEPLRWTRGVLRGAAARLAPWEEGRPVVLVEGVEDGLAVLRALPGATPWAVLGTGNAAHVALPERAEMILALDGDAAGRRGANAAAAAFCARGHRLRIATLPEGYDLDDLLTAPAGERVG